MGRGPVGGASGGGEEEEIRKGGAKGCDGLWAYNSRQVRRTVAGGGGAHGKSNWAGEGSCCA